MNVASTSLGGESLHLYLDGHRITRQTFSPWNTSGGYCDVFKGDHPTFGKVALKRPRMSGSTCSESQLRNFLSEGRIWKELRHPNVLQFVGMIETDDVVWLVSVFAENGTLLEYIGEYPEVDRHHLILQFTSGLAYLHSKDVVHGDLKSPNLLISAQHKLLIGDFGLSKLAGISTATSKKGVGSTPWMAPELFGEAQTKTMSSDVYAYGITISEILRQELPFTQYANQLAVMKAILEHKRPPTDPQESPQGKSYETLWEVAQECWDQVPSKRPSMLTIWGRFGIDYTRMVDSAIPSVTHAYETDLRPSLSKGSITYSEPIISVRGYISCALNFGKQRGQRKEPRIFQDLIFNQEGKYANWDPEVEVKVGDFGVMDDDTGAFTRKGSIYEDPVMLEVCHGDIKKYEPIQGEPGGQVEVAVNTVSPPDLSVSIPVGINGPLAEGSWGFKKERGAVFVMTNVALTSMPNIIPDDVLNKLVENHALNGMGIVTAVWKCSGYVRYLSSKGNDRLSIRLVADFPVPQAPVASAGSPIAAYWECSKGAGSLKQAYRGGNGMYTGMYTLKTNKRQGGTFFR